MKTLSLVISLAAGLVFTTTAHAQELELAPERTNSVNVSPLGLLIGSYSVNYEKLFGGSHGLLVEGYFANSSGDDASAFSLGLSVGYRWHWSGKQNSGFLGVNAGYGLGGAEATINTGAVEKTFSLDTTALALTANVGKRWAWDSGLNITLRIGAGYGNYGVSTDDPDPDAQDAVEAVDTLLSFLPVAIDGELSIGYTF